MFSVSKYFLVIVVLSVVTFSATIVVGQSQWTRYGSTAILTAPGWAPGIGRPRALYDGKAFRMWFSGVDAKGIPLEVGYATSADGMKWFENGQPVLTAGGGWEGDYISIGSVIWNGSQFMMWYQGDHAFGLATSADGVTWAKYSGNPVMTRSSIDSDFMSAPYVIQVGSTFKMWYTCQNPALSGLSICYATSNDGKSWLKQSAPVLESMAGWEGSGLYSPAVVFDGGNYGMWYSGGYEPGGSWVSQIGYATSKNGLSWTRDPNNPILSPGPSGAWDGGFVENPCVVQYNGGFLLYYDGAPLTQVGLSIGLAQSPASFVLPEIISPTVTLGVAACIVLTGLSLRKRR